MCSNVFIFKGKCVCIYIHIYKYMYTYTIYIYIYIYIYVFIYLYLSLNYVHISTHTHIHPGGSSTVPQLYQNCVFVKAKLSFFGSKMQHGCFLIFIVGSTSLTALRWSKRNDQSKPIFARRFQLISCRLAMPVFFNGSSWLFSHLHW